jgi:hypothetical protein
MLASMPPFGVFCTKQKETPYMDGCPSECDDIPALDSYFNILTLNTSVILSNPVTWYSVHYLSFTFNNNTRKQGSDIPFLPLPLFQAIFHVPNVYVLRAHTQPQSWTTPFQLPASAYSACRLLACISGGGLHPRP